MDATRREALVGAAATAAMMGAAGRAAPRRTWAVRSRPCSGPPPSTPCDKSLKFDPGAFRDILAWYKHCGADGVVVLGTSGEFPSFSVAERRQIAETALKDKNGLNVIIGPGTSNHRRDDRAGETR